MTRAFIFPGQGSQSVGMGKSVAEAFATARELFEEIDEALRQHLSKLMWEGPETDLILTENAQPAIMAASMAIVRVLQREGGLDIALHARVVAGHSLGEYTALCAAGAIELGDAARLLKKRGRAMQRRRRPVHSQWFHHLPRPEDWPILSTIWHSVSLVPYGFFDHNPSLDLRRDFAPVGQRKE